MAALDALARRDHAVVELQRKLCEKGYDPPLVGRVLDQLVAEKLLNDGRFVGAYVAQHAARGQGPVRVRAQLHRMGLQGTLVEETLLAYAGWLEDVRKTRRKKFGTALPTDYPDKQRQARFLAYRGFTNSQIRLALGLDTDLDVETDL